MGTLSETSLCDLSSTYWPVFLHSSYIFVRTFHSHAGVAQAPQAPSETRRKPTGTLCCCWEDYEIHRDIYLLSLVNVGERSNLTVFVGTKDFAQGAGGHFTVQAIDINSLIFVLFTHRLVTLPFGSGKENKFNPNLVLVNFW